jgi:hypothetical protein
MDSFWCEVERHAFPREWVYSFVNSVTTVRLVDGVAREPQEIAIWVAGIDFCIIAEMGTWALWHEISRVT